MRKYIHYGTLWVWLLWHCPFEAGFRKKEVDSTLYKPGGLIIGFLFGLLTAFITKFTTEASRQIDQLPVYHVFNFQLRHETKVVETLAIFGAGLLQLQTLLFRWIYTFTFAELPVYAMHVFNFRLWSLWQSLGQGLLQTLLFKCTYCICSILVELPVYQVFNFRLRHVANLAINLHIL